MDANKLSTPRWARRQPPTPGRLGVLALALAFGLAGALAGCGSSSNNTTNGAPTAAISVASTTLNKGATETLDGSGSSDPEGATLTYAWTVSGGSLSSATAAKPTFTAPYNAASVTVSLTVNDGTQNSAAVTQTLTIQDQAPVAKITADSAYNGNETVYLDGSGSSDPDAKDVISYAWSASCTGGSTISLSDPTSARPYFVVPDADDTCTANLTVSDGTDTNSTSASFSTYTFAAGTTVATRTQNPFRNIDASVTPLGMAFANNNLYVADSSNKKVLIYSNVGSTSVPTQLVDSASSGVSLPSPTSFTTVNAAQALAVTSTYAYVAVASDGLQVYNLSSAVTTNTSGSFNGIATDIGIYSSGGVTYALLVDSSTDYIWDYSVTSGTISYVTKIYVPGAKAIAVDSTKGAAYVASSSGVTALSLSTVSASLSTAGSISLSEAAQGVAVRGGYLYVADGASGLYAYSISGSGSTGVGFTQVASYSTKGRALAVDVDSNGYAYVVDPSGLYVLDSSIPASMYLIGSYVVPNAAHVVADTNNNYVAYVAGSSELDAINVNPASKSSVQSTTSVSGGVFALHTMGNRLYRDRLSVDDISSAYSPSQSDSYSPSGSGSGYDIAQYGDDLFEASTDSGLEIVNTRTQGSLSRVGQLTSVGTAYSVALSSDGKTAYVGSSTGFNVVDVSTPSSPSLSGSQSSLLSLLSMAVYGTDVYATSSAGGSAMAVYDVSTASSPTIAGTYGTNKKGYGLALSTDGSYAYLARSTSGLDVVSISTPSSPTLTTSVTSFFNGDDVQRVALAGRYLVVAAGPQSSSYPAFNNGIVILDVSAPGTPTLAGEYETSMSSVGRLAVEGNTIYLGTDSGYIAAQLSPTFTRATKPTAAAGASYTLSWQPPSGSPSVYVRCTVSVGTCKVGTINTTTNSTTVTWSGLTAGDEAEIRFSVGNQHYFTTAIDHITAQ